MDIRIGVTYTPKEVSVELDDSADASALKSEIDKAVAGEGAVLWLTDKKGNQVGIPADKIAYVEIGSDDDSPRIGFGG